METEKWRTIPGCNNHYQISNKKRIRNKFGKIMKTRIVTVRHGLRSYRYETVTLSVPSKSQRTVSKLFSDVWGFKNQMKQNQKLKPGDKSKIFEMHQTGNYFISQIAEKFGISKSYAKQIIGDYKKINEVKK